MIKSKTLIEKVNDRYASLRAKHVSSANYNANLLRQIDGFTETENELGSTRFLLAKAEYENNALNVNELKNRIDYLENKLLVMKNSVNTVKINYECPICKDRGYVDGKRCKCFNKNLTDVALKSLGIEEKDENEFSCFVLEDPLKKQYAIIKDYSQSFPNTKIDNLIFFGNVGTGKSMLAKCVLKTVKNNGFIGIFLSATELNSIFLKMHSGEIDRNLIFEILIDADLLVIDDLGTEPLYKNVTIEYLLSLISNRLENNKHFIITTNLSSAELIERYNERLISRLSDKTKNLHIPFKTKDFRTKR